MKRYNKEKMNKNHSGKKTKKKEKTRNENLKMILVLTAIGLVFLSIIGFSIVKYTKINTESVVIEEYAEDLDWLSDNCDCIERERFKCSDGFEVDEERRLCFKENEITNVLLGCSMYNCSGEIKKVK